MSANNALPLAGKRVLVTRAPEQARALEDQLETLGATVVFFPTVSFAPMEDTAPLDQVIRGLAAFEWLIFTSQNAVRFFVERCRALGLDWTSADLPLPRVAAVGPATAEAVRARGLPVTKVATRYRGESLAEELAEEMRGKKVLLPRSNRADDALPAALRAAGAGVSEVMAYRTVAPATSDGAARELISHGEVDVVAFASPSAFHGFVETLGSQFVEQLSCRTMFAAIGPTTAAAIRETGLPVAIEAAESTSAGLAEAIAGYFAPAGAMKR